MRILEEEGDPTVPNPPLDEVEESVDDKTHKEELISSFGEGKAKSIAPHLFKETEES